MSERAPILPAAAAFVFGIVAEAHGIGLAYICVCVAAVFFRRDAATAGFLGAIIGCVHGHPAVVERGFHTAQYSGTVVGDVRSEDGLVSFPLRVAGFGTLRASSRQIVSAGERLIVRGRIEPLDEARNPGEPAPRDLAIDDGITGELNVAHVVAREAPDFHDLQVWAPIARQRAGRIVHGALAEPAATLLAGALWGERGTLPQDVRDDFQATGTVHVLVTAGLHLGIVATLLTVCFATLRIPRIAASLITIPIVYGYAWFSGWHLPAQRAAAMVTVALIARACGARTVSRNTLALAAIVVAASWPVSVSSVSFALSFSCVAAIVLFAPTIRDWLEDRRLPEPLTEVLSLTVAAQLGVWPLTAATFFNVSPYAIVANAIVVPIVGLTMMLGLAIIATHPIVALAAVLARWDSWLLTGILATTHVIAALPAARMTITPPPIWAIAVYDAGAIGAAWLLPRRTKTAAGIIAVACLGVILTANFRPSKQFSIIALDVGQADAIVIRTPHGRTVVIDTGGRLERGATIDGRSPAERSAERVVIPYLRRTGITRIDLLVLTHPHGDHVGGSPAILTMMPVGWVADSGQRYGGRAYNDALAAARMRHVAVIVPACHQRWVDDDVTLTFLSPCGPPFSDGKNDVNENSLVVLVQYRKLRALFMGDAGFQSEDRLLRQGVDLHADILKVGHHGSAYSSSSAFIEAVHPRVAIVSVGRHNLFGHPAPITLETLRLAGASIFRTDQCGAVTVTTGEDGRPSISTMLSCARKAVGRTNIYAIGTAQH